MRAWSMAVQALTGSRPVLTTRWPCAAGRELTISRLRGGTFALHFAAGDGDDMVHLTAGAEAAVVLDPSLNDGYRIERGEDSLTLRFGAGLSITFQGLAGAGSIGIGRFDRVNVTLLHQPPGLDQTL